MYGWIFKVTYLIIYFILFKANECNPPPTKSSNGQVTVFNTGTHFTSVCLGSQGPQTIPGQNCNAMTVELIASAESPNDPSKYVHTYQMAINANQDQPLFMNFLLTFSQNVGLNDVKVYGWVNSIFLPK